MLSLLFPPYGWKIKTVAGIAAAIALWFAWCAFTEHYREQGRAELRPKLVHAINLTHAWKKSYDTLGQLTAACNASVDNLHAESEQRKKEAQQAINEAEKRASRVQPIIESAKIRESAKSGTCEQAVTDAKNDLKGLL